MLRYVQQAIHGGWEIFQDKLCAYARASIIAGLRRSLKNGTLLLQEGERSETIGIPRSNDKSVSGIPDATLVVKDKVFWLRFYLREDIGFAQSYVYGEYDTSNLTALLQLWMDNHKLLEKQSTIPSMLRYAVSAMYVRVFGQTLSKAHENAIVGYDWAPTIFSSMLSSEQTYSCAFWPDDLGGVRGDINAGFTPGDLESAQLVKINHVLDLARVSEGTRLLEFGSGWGSLAIEAARRGAQVDTLTLSIEQQRVAATRIRKLGLDRQIRVHLLDYRKVPDVFQRASFDAFAGVEMVEAVGVRYLPTFFHILDWALKPQAAAVIVSTCQPEDRFTTLQANDFARSFQWPNSFCPSPTYLLSVAERATRGAFVIESIENFSVHYPRTLREWNYRLQGNWNQATITALLNERPELAHGDRLLQVKRNFEYMLAYAAVGFANAYTGLMVFTFSRPEFVRQKCD